MRHPFLFLGQGEGPGTFDVLVGLESPTADVAPLTRALEVWGAPHVTVDAWENLVSVEAKLKRTATLHETLARALTEAHHSSPIALVVRKNRVKPGPWHHESIAEPSVLLDVLERQVRARASRPYRHLELDTARTKQSLYAAAWASLGDDVSLGALVQAALKLVTGALKQQKAALVWQDLLMSRLPTWVGHDFGVDLAIVEQLSAARGVAPTTVEMPPHFKDTFDDMVRASHDRRRWASAPKLDWADRAAVGAAMGEGRWTDLQTSFVETNRDHVETLFALSREERATLAGHERLATLMMNVATFRMTSGDFRGALTLYDDALEGHVEASAAANPLYAVADDNNHLGVDPARARHYLAKCLPLGPENPAIFLNAACLAAELGAHDEALRHLEAAKAHGFPVKDHRNERVFVPLRERAAFKKVMR
ncbi:MAG: hypothetical protein JNJ54_06235 [Myxococcaceae bacterium]|nr:hypothetical protein [Myxococcaceae bacterium]